MFSPLNYPGARYSTAYWENNDQNKLYFFSGLGAYDKSINKTFQDHVRNYFDGGDDVWAYDLTIKQWAWISGSSKIVGASPISTAPGTDAQTPGSFYGDISFGKSWDSNLLILGPGSSGTFWLWQFDSNLWIWKTISQINLANQPSFPISRSVELFSPRKYLEAFKRTNFSIKHFDKYFCRKWN
jgi:hypothetical protein